MNKIKERLKMARQELRDNMSTCCNDPCITSKEGDNVCLHCGMVTGRNFISMERRAYTNEEIKNRKRTEPKWRKFGPRTMLPNSKVDSKGRTIGLSQRMLYSRLSKIQNSLLSSTERNLWEAYPKMKILTSILIIPEYIKITAWRIYSLVAVEKLTMGRSIDGFIAAALYASIRIHGFPRLLEEVCEAAMTPRRTVHKSLGRIIKDVLPQLGLRYRPITPEQLIYRFGNDLKLPLEIQKDAMILLVSASQNGLPRAGKDPKGLAASVVYMAAKKVKEYRKTQTEVSTIANITEVTLRSRSKEIKTLLNL